MAMFVQQKKNVILFSSRRMAYLVSSSNMATQAVLGILLFIHLVGLALNQTKF